MRPAKTYFLRAFLIHLLFLGIFYDAIAQDSIPDSLNTIHLLDEMVITSTRKNTSQQNLPYSVSVIHRKFLDEFQCRTAPEALIGMSGVFVQKTNHGGGSPFIRGLTGNQILTMVDGIRLNNPTFRYGPNQYLNTIDPYSISKIEVVRSSGSVQYGSDAMGGIMQIFTKDPQFKDNPKWSLHLLGKAMTKDMEYTGRSELAYESRRVALLVGGTKRSFGDLVGGDTTGVQSPSGYNEESFDGKLRWRWTNRTVFTAAHQQTSQFEVPLYHKVKLENYEYYFFDPQRRQLTYFKLETTHDKNWIQKVSLTASLQQSDESRKYHKNNDAHSIEETDIVKTMGGILDIQSVVSDQWSFNSGIEYYYSGIRSRRTQLGPALNEKIELRGLYPDKSLTHNISVFSLHHFNVGHLIVEGGLRYNYFNLQMPNADTALSEDSKIIVAPASLVSNLSSNYQINQRHSVFASFSMGYRAPNIDDLATLGLVDFRYEVPAYHLKPEKSYNSEIGYRYTAGSLQFAGSAFYTQLTNLIIRKKLDDQQINGYNVYVKENSDQSYIRGFEMSLEWNINPSWTILSTASYAFGQNLTANEPLRRIPPFNGKTIIGFNKGNLHLTFEHLYANKQSRLAKGDKEDNRIPQGGTPGWNIFNLVGHYELKNITLRLGLENLLNEDYRMHGSGINGVGRSGWIALELKL